MACLTEFFGRIVSSASCKATKRKRTPNILKLGDRLKMVEAHASRNPAKVIQLVALWDSANYMLPKAAMGHSVSIREAKHPVVPSHCSRPQPALTAGIDFIEEPLKPRRITHAVIVPNFNTSLSRF